MEAGLFMNEGALATLDDSAAIAEIASGTLSKEIAARYGVTPYAVRKRLAKHPDYPQAIKDQAESFVEEATDEAMSLGEGCDMVAIARARVKIETAHKWAAARNPEQWGNKQTVTVNQGITMDQALDGMAQALLAKMRVVPNDAEQQSQCSIAEDVEKAE